MTAWFLIAAAGLCIWLPIGLGVLFVVECSDTGDLEFEDRLRVVLVWPIALLALGLVALARRWADELDYGLDDE